MLYAKAQPMILFAFRGTRNAEMLSTKKQSGPPIHTVRNHQTYSSFKRYHSSLQHNHQACAAILNRQRTLLATRDLFVGRIEVFGNGEELLLDKTRAGEAEHGVRRAGLVVSTASTAATEALLANRGGGGLAVYRFVSIVIRKDDVHSLLM